jgi:hypothetical protein
MLGDTQPTRVVRRRAKSPLWPLAAAAGVVVIAACALLTLPFLLTAPPDDSGGYDLPILAEASARLAPDANVLLETRDGAVAVFAPMGSYAQTGTLIIQTRRPELVPFQVEQGVERIQAVDLLVLDSNGQVKGNVIFDQPILVCFRLTPDLEALRQADGGAVSIQWFDDQPEALAWVDMPGRPGWLQGQLCTAVDHLSLYALVVRVAQTPTALPATGIAPADPTATPGVYLPPSSP